MTYNITLVQNMQIKHGGHWLKFHSKDYEEKKNNNK